jgi:uncharacterized protein
MKIINQTQGTVIAQKSGIADNFLTRLIGLLNRKSLNSDEGLYITPCNSIHSWFMRFIFDAIFIDENMQVIHIINKMPSFKFSPIIKGAKGVIELPAGKTSETKTQLGDIIGFVK